MPIIDEAVWRSGGNRFERSERAGVMPMMRPPVDHELGTTR
jgi:hypothetical protein